MITYHHDLIQGTDEWLQVRCGLITASTVKSLLTPTMKVANNDKTRLHLNDLCAQRVTGFVEPSFVSDDMMRGNIHEVYARDLYHDKIAPVQQMGFITNDRWGFTIGYSPDGLVGDDGLIEIKSRLQKYQFRTIVTDEIDTDYILQLQTGLLVTERKWIDFIQYSGGMPMFVKRVYPDAVVHEAIVQACSEFEQQVKEIIEQYHERAVKFLPTERVIIEDNIII